MTDNLAEPLSNEMRIHKTIDDLSQVSRFVLRRYQREALPYLIAAWLVAVGVYYYFLDLMGSVLGHVDAYAGFALATVSAIIIFLGILRFVRRPIYVARVDERGSFLEPLTFSMGPDGITETSATRKTSIAWPGILRIADTKKHVLFFIDRAAAVVVPKKALGDDQHVKTFVRTANHYWQAARTEVPHSSGVANDAISRP